MRLVHLPTLWTVLLDGLVWLVVHLSLGYYCTRLPLSALDPQRWLFQTHRWERGGALYERLLGVRRWKSWLPSGGVMFGGFSMRRVASHGEGHVARWVAESCRAELTHWLAILPVAFFVLWNPPVAVAANVAYALCANLPCIVVQRYNRPRLVRLLGRVADRAAGHREQPIPSER